MVLYIWDYKIHYSDFGLIVNHNMNSKERFCQLHKS